ncbi:hypothetical protein ACWCQL_30980 [Streptomyces sp. NPDC002073]
MSATLAVAAGLIVLVPQEASAGIEPVPETSVFLNRGEGEGAGIDRPVLEGIKDAAQRQGVSFDEALRGHIARAAAAPPAPGSQPDGPVDTPDVMVDDLTAGEIEDIRAMAASEGKPLEAAIGRYGWQDRFEAVAAQLEAAYPDTFAGAVKAEGGAWFAFKGPAPAEALALADDLPAPVEVVSNRRFSEADLVVAQEQAHAQVMGRSDVASATSAYDLKAAEVRVDVELADAPAGATARRAAVRSLVPSLESPGTEVPVVVRVSEKPVYEQQDNYTRGGGYLSYGCTSGFNLKYLTSNTKRLGTAGHCTVEPSQTYSNHPRQPGSTRVDAIWTHQGASGDLGYTSIGAMQSSRTFYQDYNNVRYADDRAGMPAVGTLICKFGRTSGKSCSTGTSPSAR